MVKASGYGMSAEVSGKEALTFIVLLIGIVIVGYYLVTKWLFSIPGAITGAVTDTIKKRIDTQETAIASAAGRTKPEYQEYLNDMGIVQQAAVTAGNIITPTAVLTEATKQGAAFAKDLTQSGDMARYQNLDPISKGFVTFGEWASRTLGVSSYDSGKAVKNWLTGAKT